MALPETEQALADLASNNVRMSGMHATGTLRVGTQGMYVDTETYDPVKHSPLDIDPLSPFSLVYGEDQVTRVMPERPLGANVLIDLTARHEHPVVGQAKTKFAYDLSGAIKASLPGMNDRLYSYVTTGVQGGNNIPFDHEIIKVENPDELNDIVNDLVVGGLTFVISDFRTVSPARLSHRLNNSLIAVKVNHPSERVIPAGVGHVPLGNGKLVNSNKPKQLAAINEQLEAQHTAIVDGLEAAGAAVVSIITAPSQPNLYDSQAADQALAEAIRTKT